MSIIKTETIKEIKIDNNGRLQVVPSVHDFTQIFLSAMEVHWDSAENCLYAPQNMKDWSYVDWFKQILKAVRSEYGYILIIDNDTKWSNVPNDLMERIKSV